jgi:hypothetical protein
VYTCATGRTVILKDIRFWAAFGAIPRVALYLSSGAGQVSIVDRALANVEAYGAAAWCVLEPGDQLWVFSQTNNVRYWFSGTELDGVAP